MSLNISLIQTQLAWEDKAANLSLLEKKIAGIEQPTEVVLLPEMFSTGFSMNPVALAEPMEGPTFHWMKEISLRQRIVLVGSIIVEEKGFYYNRLICMLPNGQCGYYDKRHLFAFAGEDKHYTAGNRRLIASVKGWRINMQVCYDLRFPVWARQQNFVNADEELEPEYDLLVYVANWPERRRHAWQTLLAARAIENQCFVLGVNRVGSDGNGIYHSGDSMVVDPLGEVYYHMADEEDVFTATIYKDQLKGVREKFPFWRDADDFRILSEE